MYGVHRQHLWLRSFCGTYRLCLSIITVLKPFIKWIDYFCSFIESNLSWRLPLFLQVVIGAILAGGSLFMPESPR